MTILVYSSVKSPLVSANLCPCHTYENPPRNSFACHTSKTKNLKSFACHTSEKTEGRTSRFPILEPNSLQLQLPPLALSLSVGALNWRNLPCSAIMSFLPFLRIRRRSAH